MTDLATESSSTTTSSPCVPPGFRFHPTDEELTGYYLRKKVASHKIDLDVIREIDLYKIEPWDLQDKCGMGYEEQKEWYFFSHKDKKYPTGTRTNRATMSGFWKATGRDKAVYDFVNKAKLIGMRKTLVFYKGRAPNGHKTDWIMHEYRLLHDSQDMIIINTPPQEEQWVVCRAFKKRSQTKINNIIINNDKWDTSAAYSFLDQHTGSIDPTQHAQQPGSVSEYSTVVIGNKPETVEAADFVQLPPLEITPQDSDDIINCNPKNSTVRTNWRDLDKFVASQLSHGDRSYDVDQYSRSSFEAISNYCDFKDRSDLAMLLPQNGGVELVPAFRLPS